MIVGIYNGNGNWNKPSDIPNNLILNSEGLHGILQKERKSQKFQNFNKLYPNTELLDLTNLKLTSKGLEIKIENTCK